MFPVRVSRRAFLVTSCAAISTRVLPQVVARSGGRRILTLVRERGVLRAVERVVP